MVPAVTEIAAIIAVDHSNVLTRRRRSTMKSGVSQFEWDKHPGCCAAAVQAQKPCRCNAKQALTAQTGAASVRRDGDGVPRNRPRRLMTPIARRWRWESVSEPPQGGFLLP